MGMYDVIDVQYPLPDGFDPPAKTEWQTKDTPEQYLAHYRLEADGTLRESTTGRSLAMHGTVSFYATNITGTNAHGVITRDNALPWWAEYQCLYDHGQLLKIEGGRRFETEKPLRSREEFFADMRPGKARRDTADQGA